jgi:serine/threonine-protein kinase
MRGLPASNVRKAALYIKAVGIMYTILFLMYGGLLIIAATVFSEGFSLWALTVQSSNKAILIFVLFSTLGLLIIMALPALGRLAWDAMRTYDLKRHRTSGIRDLQTANRDEERRKVPARFAIEEESERHRREELAVTAHRDLGAIADALRKALVKAAPLAESDDTVDIGWTLSLNGAEIQLSNPSTIGGDPWGSGWRPAFDVISVSKVRVSIPTNRFGYKGRSHSLWYCDAHRKGRYSWYETAFMPTAFAAVNVEECPFELAPSVRAAQAIGPGFTDFQLARPFTRLHSANLADFIIRWAGWFADGSQGSLNWPETMPEGMTQRNWRSIYR